MSSICTFTGKAFDFENVKPEDICIKDIAHALSMTCRYGGHVDKFYSVAEHCVLLSEAENMPGTPLARLLHDAVEAYVGDVPRPLKNLLLAYQLLEARLQKIIEKKYGVDFGPTKPGDTAMLEIEAAAIMPPEFFTIHNRENPDGQLRPRAGNTGVTIQCWSPEVAEMIFIARAAALGVLE